MMMRVVSVSVCVIAISVAVHFYITYLVGEEYDLVIGIMSARDHVHQRSIIRDTWLQTLKGLKQNVAYRFVVGESCPVHHSYRVQYSCDQFLIPNNTETGTYQAVSLVSIEPDSHTTSCPSLAFRVNCAVIITHLGILTRCAAPEISLGLFNLEGDTLVSAVRAVDENTPLSLDGYSYYRLQEYSLPAAFEGSVDVVFDDQSVDCPVADLAIDNVTFVDSLLTVYRYLSDPLTLNTNQVPILNFIYKVHYNDDLDKHNMLVNSQLWLEEEKESEIMLRKEQEKFRDILFVPCIDVYRNLPEKILHFFSFGHALNGKQVLKTDDDTYVVVKRIITKLETLKMKKLWWGNFRVNWAVSRTGKWRELDYKSSAYPAFASGVGYVLGSDVVHWLVTNARALHRYQGEDTSLGIWLAAIRPTLYQDDKWSGDGRCPTDALALGQLNASAMQVMYDIEKRCGHPCIENC